MTQPDTNGDEYISYSQEPLNQQDMEAVVANTDQEVDVDQAIRHNMYIGWVLGKSSALSAGLSHAGGNLVQLDGMPGVTLVVPYPPQDWKP